MIQCLFHNEEPLTTLFFSLVTDNQSAPLDGRKAALSYQTEGFTISAYHPDCNIKTQGFQIVTILTFMTRVADKRHEMEPEKDGVRGSFFMAHELHHFFPWPKNIKHNISSVALRSSSPRMCACRSIPFHTLVFRRGLKRCICHADGCQSSAFPRLSVQ
jgi:hypothetical protein